MPGARILTLIAVAALTLLPAWAHAGGCTVATTSINFGSYNVFATAPTDSTATITYHCSGTSAIAIGITRGQSETFAPRVQSKGPDELKYNLYLDPARTTVWGDTSSGTQIYYNTSVPNNRDVTLTVYGRIPPGQDASAGSYTDSVSVIVLF